MLQYQVNHLKVFQQPITKFKTIKISLVFEQPFSEVNLYARRMLTHILSTSSAKYQTEAKIIKNCVNLYNLSLNFFNVKVGLNYLTTLDIGLLAPKYVDDARYFLKVMTFVNELLCRPLLENNHFPQRQIEDSYRQLYHSIQVIKSNKPRVSELKFEKILFKDQPQALDNLIDEELLQSVTKEDIMKSYQQLLQSSAYVVVTGDVSEREIEKVFSKTLPFKTLSAALPYVDKSPYEEKNEVVTEVVSTNQSLLLMGYRIPIYKYDEKYWAVRMLNAMLGEYFHSSLIRVIREELGLAYAVSSVYFSRLGALVIQAGIAGSKGDIVISEINKILTSYQEGVIDLEIFEKSKKSLVSSLTIAEDSLYEYFIEGIDTKGNEGSSKSIQQMIKQVNDLTLADVQDVSRLLRLDTTYFMKGE